MAITSEDFKKLKKDKILRHKFGAIRCECDGIKFPSKLERDYYLQLIQRMKTGEVVNFHRQALCDLGGGVKYYCDFQVFLSDGTVEYIDTKGKDTALSIAKRKLTENRYPFEIKIVNKV